jgi:hypothetical protein
MKKIAFISCALAILTSCGSSLEPKEGYIVPQSTSVEGELSGCFDVINKQYLIQDIHGFSNSEDLNNQVFIEFIRTEQDLPFKQNEFSAQQYDYKLNKIKKYLCELAVEVYDTEGNLIEELDVENDDQNGLINLLQLKKGQMGVIAIDYSIAPNVKAASFKVKSKVTENDTDPSLIDRALEDAFNQ